MGRKKLQEVAKVELAADLDRVAQAEAKRLKKEAEDREQQKQARLADLKKMVGSMNRAYEKQGGEANARIHGQKKMVFLASEMQINYVYLGLPQYDLLAGGDPLGLIVIDYGPKGAGKSTFNYFKIARFQRMGKICCVVNMEGCFDPKWAAICGVILDELIVIEQGITFEETAQAMWEIMKTNNVDHFLVDSIQGQLTNKEMFKGKDGPERDIQDDTVGALPLKIGQLLKRIIPKLGKSNCTLTIIGQARTDIGAYGAPISLTGGHALKHFARRIMCWSPAAKSEWPKRGEEIIGMTSRVVIQHQQLNEHQGEFFMMPFRKGRGLYTEMLLVEEALRVGIIEQVSMRTWKWNSPNGEVAIDGKTELYKIFEDNKEYLEQLAQQLAKIVADRTTIAGGTTHGETGQGVSESRPAEGTDQDTGGDQPEGAS